jgi:hypothetical protein
MARALSPPAAKIAKSFDNHALFRFFKPILS